MRVRPAWIEALPEQYFGALPARVAAQAALEDEPLIDLGRGSTETGPPAHVVEALNRIAKRPDVHGYAPFRGLPELRQILAEPYRPKREAPRESADGMSSPNSVTRTKSCAMHAVRTSSSRTRILRRPKVTESELAGAWATRTIDPRERDRAAAESENGRDAAR